MRHRNIKSRLNRHDAHRKATLALMAKAMFIHQSIKTTYAKAKVARKLIERLITTAKHDSVNARRKVFSVIRDEDVVARLFKEIAPLFSKRIGGYTRIISLKNRRGDGAEIVLLELVEKVKEAKPEKKAKLKKEKKTKTEDTKKEHEKPEEHHKAVPEVKQEIKEERVVEDVKKDRARKEDKKVEDKGFFKKFFRRKQGM